MHRTAHVLSVVSVVAAVLVFSVTQLAFPPVGFEGMMAVAGLSVLVSLLSGTASLVVCGILFARKSKPRPVQPLLVSVKAFCALAIALWLLRPPTLPNNAINTDSGNQSSFVALVSAAGYGGRCGGRPADGDVEEERIERYDSAYEARLRWALA